jgi:hypothetical protein
MVHNHDNELTTKAIKQIKNIFGRLLFKKIILPQPWIRSRLKMYSQNNPFLNKMY